ncbi:unnamed protein product [marine sediment metagenome]|uniref:Uncharacterized protein n=1 Tax=marine sediment metagenome TaxID=412755 RepID=X1MY28_9ZZZZ
MNLTDKIEQRTVDFGKGNRTVTVVIAPLTKKEAREMFPYRPYHRKYAESKFGGNTRTDDSALLLSEDARRCVMCTAPTRKEYLEENVCPDCNGRSEYNGVNPREAVK